MGSHSVTWHLIQVNTPCRNPSQTDRYWIYLPRRNGRLSWPRWLITWFTRPQTVIHPSTNPAVHSRESNSQPVDHKSDALNTALPSDLKFAYRTATPVRYCPSRVPVFLWSPLSCRTSQDHSRVLRACTRGPPKDWRCRTVKRHNFPNEPGRFPSIPILLLNQPIVAELLHVRQDPEREVRESKAGLLQAGWLPCHLTKSVKAIMENHASEHKTQNRK